MSSGVEPIGVHEAAELAEISSYYIRRNFEALKLLAQSDTFPSIEDSSGASLMHYETMVIRSVELMPGQKSQSGQVRLHPALPINGAAESDASNPIVVTLLDGTEVRGGFIALLQRMNFDDAIGGVYFFSDDRTGSEEVSH